VPARSARIARFGAAVLAPVIVVALVAAPGPHAVADTVPSAADAALVYFRNNREFLARKRLGGDGFDWSDNGCSVPWALRLSVPTLSFAARTFAAECSQHDFAYRNFGGVLRLDPSAARRLQVDRHFYRLLRARCTAADIVRRHAVLLCRFYARAFYRAVRIFGSFGRPSRVASRPRRRRSRGWRGGPVR